MNKASSEHKKYPADTPVTLQMLADILRKVSAKAPIARWICETVEEHIEPPKPESKIGELWLCEHNGTGDLFALWKFTGGWAVFQTGVNIYKPEMVTPLTRIMPMNEGSDE